LRGVGVAGPRHYKPRRPRCEYTVSCRNCVERNEGGKKVCVRSSTVVVLVSSGLVGTLVVLCVCVLSRAYLTLHPLGLRQRLGSIYDRVWLEEQQMKASAAAAILCAYYYTSKAGEEAVKAVEADWPQTHIYSVYSSLHNIYIYDQKVSCCCIIFFFVKSTVKDIQPILLFIQLVVGFHIGPGCDCVAFKRLQIPTVS